MSDKLSLTEVELFAFTQIIAPANSDLSELASPIADTRNNAYRRIHALFIDSPELTDKIPVLFAGRGDTISALATMEAQLDLGHPMSLDHIVALLGDSCYRYVAVFRQNDIDKQDQREDPGCINDDAISRTEAFLSEIQTRVGHLLEKTGDEPGLVRTKAKYELVVNNDRAKAIECLTYLIDTEEVAVSDFITLGNLLYEVGDLEQAVHIFETGFHRTGSTVLFGHVVRYMIEAQGEGEARAFYERSSGELPFSFLRGTIISLDELPDVERLIAVFFSSGISHEWQSEYIRNTSDYISSQIIFHEELEERTLSSRPKKGEKGKELNIQSEIPISLLELYEFQIYYLLEYANLEKYLSIISEHLQSEKGKAFLTSYFEDHSLEQLGTFFDVDALDEVEDMSPPLSEQEHIDGTTTSLETLPDGRAVYIPVVDQRDPSGDDRGDSISYTIGSLDSVGMRNHINRRYAYLQMRLASYDPYGEILQVRRSDLDSSLEGTEAGMEVVSGTDTIDPLNSMRKELMIITDTLRETHPESDMFLESVILAQKVRTEEKRLLHAGPEAKQSYRELIEILDAKYSVTERRYLQWQARDGSYIGADLPPCCKGSPDLVMFFICERILAGCMESFEEKLSEIIHAEPILQLHPIQILTFLEILISQGCYDEAFSIIIRYDSSLYDVDMLFLLAKILADVGHESEWRSERQEVLDTCSREQYGEGSFREIIEDVRVKQVETLEQDDGSDAEIYETKRKGVAIMDYVLGVFLVGDEEREDSERYISQAIGAGLPEAVYFRAVQDMEAGGGDRENILDALIAVFPESEYPIRGMMYPHILELSLEHDRRDTFLLYSALALWEGVEVSMFPLRLMIQGEDTRRALYTYMMHSDQHFDLLEQDLRALQEAIDSDIRMPSVPLGIKLRASLLKNNIASHPEYGFLPSIFEHVDFLGSSIGEMQSGDCPMICTQILLDLHRTFDTSGPEHIQFANLLNYHVTYLRAKIVEFIQSHTADKEKQRGGLTYYAMFIDSVLTLLLRIPTIRNISIRLDPEDPKTTLGALDYWISEQEKNKILLHNLGNQDNLKVSSPLIFPGIQADGSYIFPPHPTIQ